MKRIVFKIVVTTLFFLHFSFLPAQNSDKPRNSSLDSDNLIHSTDNIRSGASIGFLSSEDINFIGTLYFDFPFLLRNEKSAYVHIVLSNAAIKYEDSFSFKALDLNYRIMVGARDYLTNKLIVSAFVAQQGVEKIDKEGSSLIKYVGFSMESNDYRAVRARKGLSWYGEIGAIFSNKNATGEITFKGDARFNYLLTEKWIYGLDFSIDSLINDFNTSNDWKIGPRITFCSSCSSAPSAFIYYMNNGNPLGFQADGFFIGVDYRERADESTFETNLPEINGNFSAGAGDGRKESRLSLKFDTPPFKKSSTFRMAFDFDTYVLTGTDTGNIYYFLIAGPEREWKNLVQGAYLYHRSNHQLAEQNDRITSLNVAEVGISSKGWDSKDILEGLRIPIASTERTAILNFIVRAGFLLDSSYGTDRKWNARAGTRIDFPLEKSRFSPFISAYWEGGDVLRKEVSIGFRTPLDFDLALQYKKDEQYFGTDKDAFLFVASLAF